MTPWVTTIVISIVYFTLFFFACSGMVMTERAIAETYELMPGTSRIQRWMSWGARLKALGFILSFVAVQPLVPIGGMEFRVLLIITSVGVMDTGIYANRKGWVIWRDGMKRMYLSPTLAGARESAATRPQQIIMNRVMLVAAIGGVNLLMTGLGLIAIIPLFVAECW